jgi:hypothetical protein
MPQMPVSKVAGSSSRDDGEQIDIAIGRLGEHTRDLFLQETHALVLNAALGPSRSIAARRCLYQTGTGVKVTLV